MIEFLYLSFIKSTTKICYLFQVLETLGVGDLFNATADFTTLSEQPGILFDDAVHKAKIQTDEEGT